MPETEVTSSDQIQAFLDKNGRTAVIQFYGPGWSKPCDRIAPYVQKKANETGIALIKVSLQQDDGREQTGEISQTSELAQAFGVTTLPTFFAIKNKWIEVVHQEIGASQENVDSIFHAAK